MDSANNVTYLALSMLKTAKMMVTGGGAPSGVATYYPYGQENASIAAEYKFTNQIRDPNGIDHFWMRSYSPDLGRWLTPDPAGMAAVDLTNPQSWNRYAYVLNDPASLVDPLGLDGCYNDATGATTQVSNGAKGCAALSGYTWIATEQQQLNVSPDGSWWGQSTLVQPTGIDGQGSGNACTNGMAACNYQPHPAGGGSGYYSGPVSPPIIVRRVVRLAERKTKSFLCGSSPAGNVLQWMRDGAIKGAAVGAYSGAVAGEVAGEVVEPAGGGIVGALVGAALNGAVDATMGAAAGVLSGSFASMICDIAGAYS